VDTLREEMQSTAFVDLVRRKNVPPPEIVAATNRPVIEAAERDKPRFDASVGSTTCKVYLATDTSPNDPYFATDIGRGILVVVNKNHPHWAQLSGSEGVLNYLRHCVYDAVAEWECKGLTAGVQPDTIKLLKDRLLRLPSQIEQSEASPGGAGPSAS
jgi:hypothetical protein